jgi:hypothetical protein
MANQIVQATVPHAAIPPTNFPPPCEPVRTPKPVLPPAGNVAAGGPTAGQLFPVGNR